VQDVKFDREGRVYFSEYIWLEAEEGCSAHAQRNAAAVEQTHKREREANTPPSLHKAPRCSREDTLVTLNLPLLGVLRTVDAQAGSYRNLVDLAIKRFFFARRASGMFEGLFMRRCVPLRPQRGTRVPHRPREKRLALHAGGAESS
jgi:hypothetical protein